MKLFKLSILTLSILATTSVLPLVTLSYLRNVKCAVDNRKTKKDVTEKQALQGRIVQKFQTSATKYTLANNSFQQFKNQFNSSNINIELTNKSKFSFGLKYSNYDNCKFAGTNNITVAKNTAAKSIQIGINSFQTMTAKVAAPGQKTVAFQFYKIAVLDFAIVNPASISYQIIATGTLNNSQIFAERTYSSRAQPNKKIIKKIGFFNVYNVNKSAVKFVHSSEFFIVIGIVTVALVVIAGVIEDQLVRCFVRRSRRLAETKRVLYWEYEENCLKPFMEKGIQKAKSWILASDFDVDRISLSTTIEAHLNTGDVFFDNRSSSILNSVQGGDNISDMTIIQSQKPEQDLLGDSFDGDTTSVNQENHDSNEIMGAQESDSTVKLGETAMDSIEWSKHYPTILPFPWWRKWINPSFETI